MIVKIYIPEFAYIKLKDMGKMIIYFLEAPSSNFLPA